MATKIENGTQVFITTGVPLRYRDRSGVVVGTTPRGRGVQYLVAFPGRRATPFRVSARDLKVATFNDSYGFFGRYTR